MNKSYKELCRIPTFEGRFEYVKLGGCVGQETFGFDRYLNQAFYHSREWKTFRRDMIIRDNGCDLAVLDRKIFDRIILHHLNALTSEDIEYSSARLFDPDNVVCVSHYTSNAIHYGDASMLVKVPEERKKGDTTLWKVY